MRKIAFLFGLVVMTTSLAFATTNYTAESDGTYTYTGSPVDELSVNFTQWSTSDLPSALTDDMAATESHNMAFVKWKIQSRTCGDKGTVLALFNNNMGDAGVTIGNDVTSNPPRIYLPTTSGSVTNLKMYVGNSSQWIKVFYKDDDHATWTDAGSITVTTSYAEQNKPLNTKGQTSIYLQYQGTGWPAITNLELTIDAPKEPEESVYTYDSGTGYYNYTGEPVDELSVDFTTWSTSDLPTPLADDMTLTQKDGLGFIKWKIASRNCGGEKGIVNALHNDNNTDFPSGPNNSSTTNKPRIYLPTSTTGVRNIKLYGMGNNVKLGVRYKDATHSSWTWADYIILPSSYGEASLALNTSGKTSICIENAQTSWPTITDLIVETKYILNSETGKYDYMGEPVDAINVDFTSWYAGYLPSTLSDDMPLAEMNNLGFVKWKINNNGGYALFNNNASDFGNSPTNSQTSNPPTIYFPTTLRGVISVAITYTGGNPFSMKGTYTDALQTKTETIEFAKATEPNTVVWNLNSAGQTKVYLQYFGAVWPRIRSIVFTIKDTEATPLVLWAKTDSHGNGNRINEANGETRDVYLKRDFTADGNYYTLCLPFDLTSEQVTAAFGTCTLAKLTGSAMNGNEINLNFDDVTAIEAGVPYLFLPTADIASCYFPAVTINADASRVINTTFFKMTGIYNPTVLTSDDYFLGADNYLVQVTDENPLKPFRAYFTVVENSGAGNAPARVVFNQSELTGIDNTNVNINAEKCIENGQIVIIRDGIRYNVLGTQIAK